MKIRNLNQYFHLHFIVLIFGFTGILGKLITFSTEYLVFYRLIFTIPILYLIIKIRKQTLLISKKEVIQFLLVGIIVGTHWLTFFHSIKVSNVSVALSCLASSTLFVGILEPLFHKRRIEWLEIVMGVLVLVTLSVMLGFEISYVKGAFFGILSAFLAGAFNVINKRFSGTRSPLLLTFYELTGALIPVFIVLFFNQKTFNTFPVPKDWDLLWLLLLSSVCTAYPFAAIVNLMKSLSAYTVTLAINFEPIYAIILAYYIFGDSERMGTPFYIGVAVVMLIIFAYPTIKKLKKTTQYEI
jgi:drug/metabolite transporter (DMT)-like permease